ncbi:6-phosphogluconolactonase [Halogranum amylolyticum]|uniref:6-phosphogluconolactonase n=1 Tax=Halogranum amylolyticum TaxID=660520 RepID=A0A1H8WD63_9EURY|nr:lactonase family protein [Halogranum amylolyticum]SEP25539.1 6-phosphogluconolactonase [Halogranum amylolyticum]
MAQESYLAAVGTYSASDTEGVYTVEIDTKTGALELLDGTVVGPDPTFVASHPSGRYIYAAVREDDEGRIRVLEVNHETGELRPVGSAPSGALSPCHCSVSSNGEFLLVAHYHGGAVSMLPIDDSGDIGSPTAVVNHSGSSINAERQSQPHPHSITLGPDGQFAYVPDLGTDEVVIYEVNTAEGALIQHQVIEVTPGSGPRHVSFSSHGQQMYLINELNSTIVTFDRQSTGGLVERATVSTLPPDYQGENKTAEIVAHPSGEFVFASNRGHDSIATFAIDDGGLSSVDFTPTGGKWPRHFTIDPQGKFLYVENRHSNTINVLSIDPGTGTLTPVEERLSIPEPVCMQWIPTSR